MTFVSFVVEKGFPVKNGRTIHPRVKELANLQEVKGQVKPYQIKQFMSLVERYDLTLEEE